ncbi:hypothetical protein [Cupriavidus necator]
MRNELARAFYETEALRCGWSVRQLDRQVNSQFYERIALSRNKAVMLQKGEAAQSVDIITPSTIDFARPLRSRPCSYRRSTEGNGSGADQRRASRAVRVSTIVTIMARSGLLTFVSSRARWFA